MTAPAANAKAPLISSVDDAVVLALFALPQIDILSLGSGTIRVDDLLLLLIFGRHIGMAKLLPGWLRRALWLVLASTLTSLGFAALSGRISFVSGVLYSVRPFEYMAGALLGVSIAHRTSQQLKRQLGVVVLVLSVLSVLQVAGLHVGVSRFSYGRAAGNLDGPYILAAVSAMLLFAFLAWHRPRMAALSAVPLVLSASRVTIIGVLLLLVVASRQSLPRFAKLIVLLACALAIPTFLLISGASSTQNTTPGGSTIVARLTSTHPFAGVQRGCAYADSVGRIHTQQDYFSFAYVDLLKPGTLTESDASSQVRFTRWCLLLKGLRSPETILLGYGPSFAGAAVDGEYVRYVVEQGLLGLLAWMVLWFRCLKHSDAPMRNILGIMLISGLFIDVLSSSRAMVLLWLLVGVSVGRRSSAGRIHIDPDEQIRSTDQVAGPRFAPDSGQTLTRESALTAQPERTAGAPRRR